MKTLITDYRYLQQDTSEDWYCICIDHIYENYTNNVGTFFDLIVMHAMGGEL